MNGTSFALDPAEQKKLQRKLERIAIKAPGEFASALYQEALIEAKESMKRTPVDFGFLRGSHEVQDPVWKGRDVSVVIACGGPAAPYAVYVHENLEANHKTGQAKFLESTIEESKGFMLKRVAKRISINRLATRT